MLQRSVEDLLEIGRTAEHRYHIAKRIKKPDGSVRICYDANKELKEIQGQILEKLLNSVSYPRYLQGGIRDRELARGQRANARLHVGNRTHITEDIRKFFPSVPKQVIFDIWNKLFRFPPHVAALLTRLTTKDGGLPEGARTSNLLANLVFWDTEWQLAEDLRSRGIAYSRFIDDICCSSKNNLSRPTLTHTIRSIHAMVRQKGLRLHPKKQAIAGPGTRHVTTKLLVNRKTSLPSEQRSEIRALVHQLKSAAETARNAEWYAKEFRSVKGKVAYLKQHNPSEAEHLLAELRAIEPN